MQTIGNSVIDRELEVMFVALLCTVFFWEIEPQIQSGFTDQSHVIGDDNEVTVKFGQCCRRFSPAPKDMQELRSFIQDSFSLPIGLKYGLKVAKLTALSWFKQ